MRAWGEEGEMRGGDYLDTREACIADWQWTSSNLQDP